MIITFLAGVGSVTVLIAIAITLILSWGCVENYFVRMRNGKIKRVKETNKKLCNQLTELGRKYNELKKERK